MNDADDPGTHMPVARLEPGDLTAQEVVDLHRDLGADPASRSYRKAWRAWHERGARLTPPSSSMRVTAYIDATFPEPRDRSRQAAAAAGAAAAGLGVAEAAKGGTIASGAGDAAVAAAPDAATQLAAGHAFDPVSGAPVAAPPDANTVAAAGDVDSAQWSTTPTRRRPRRWPVIVAAATVVVGAGAIGAAVVANRSSDSHTASSTTVTPGGSSAPVASIAPVVEQLPKERTTIGQCLERFRAPYRIVKNADRYVGKTAIVTGAGSREGTVDATVNADGTFTAVFTEALRQTGPNKCSGKITYTVVSIGGVTPTFAP